jgi:hypothetical protein
MATYLSKEGLYSYDKLIKEKIENNFNVSIIGMTIDGQTVTYITGDGQQHTLTIVIPQGSETEPGLLKLYKEIGSAEDGTMTQKAITEELGKKVSASIDGVTAIFN